MPSALPGSPGVSNPPACCLLIQLVFMERRVYDRLCAKLWGTQWG